MGYAAVGHGAVALQTEIAVSELARGAGWCCNSYSRPAAQREFHGTQVTITPQHKQSLSTHPGLARECLPEDAMTRYASALVEGQGMREHVRQRSIGKSGWGLQGETPMHLSVAAVE